VTWLSVSTPTITRISRAIGCDALRDLTLKVMSSMRVGMRYLEPVIPPDTLSEVQERVILRAQRVVLAADKTIDAAMPDYPARGRMIYTFGSGGVSSWMVEEIQPAALPRSADPAAATTRCR
jgi:DNA-binding MurR/RpiR family transcriptional regulator